MNKDFDWRILLIDDEEDILEVVSLALADSGWTVETAADGVFGIESCREFQPHVVITDIRMPRMDGLAVLEEIKRSHPDVEVIVATAFAEMALAIRALQLDASDFITKPIHNDALLVAVQRAQQRYRTRRKLKDYTRYLEEGWSDTTQELMDAYAYQRNLIDSSLDGIVGCDADFQMVMFNRRMEQLSGRSKSEVLHRMRFDALFEPVAAEALVAALNGGEYGGPGRLLLYETFLEHSSGSTVPVQISVTRLQDIDQAQGLVCFVRDLRQLRRLEQEMADQAHILHQDKMMSLGRLAASVAHEINNPLSGILNYQRLMARILERGDVDQAALIKFSRYLDTITTETDRCAQIVGNLLTFSRKSEEQKEPVSIKTLIERCVVLSRHRMSLDRITLDMHISTKEMTVMGDMNQLQQCVINLIFNAIDAMPKGGRLTLKACPSSDMRHIDIQVKDDGCGMSREDQAHIFEPFFTTKGQGSGVGLGLSTTYGIVQHHGGDIRVDSSPGKGTLLNIRLPARSEGSG
jgi:two-component system, NtrC family, sensor kinase